ncbi:MAG: YolD-like family protein [Bacilli bacterium]|nr:YolD-like family protein [Bacilli bacterium]
MKKWAPYKTLEDQWTTLDRLHASEEKVEKPKISNEVAEEINDKLVNYQGQEYEFFYYKNGRILKEKSTIKKIDAFNRKLILDNNIIIYLKDLIGVR